MPYNFGYMEPDLNNSPQKTEIKYPDGYENWSMDDKQKFEGSIDKLNPGELEDIHIKEDEENEEDQEDQEEHEEINTPEIVEIKEATDKNGEVIKIGDEVAWDFYGGSDNGKITSFVSRGSTVLANIYSDTEKELEINVGNIFLVREPEKVEIPIAPTPEINNEANDMPEWQRGKEWVEFEKMRYKRAKVEVEHRKIAGFGKIFIDEITLNIKKNNKDFQESSDLKLEKEDIYNYQKNIIAKRIEETFRKNAGENLTPEQEAELRSKINSKIFEELVQKENDAYLKSLKEARGETMMGKAIESAKSLLGTKTMQWYLSLSRKQRMALSFGVGSIAGLAFGATVAPGAIGVASYLTWRAARVGLAGTAGMKAGEWANKKWSAEELEIAKNKEVEDLKNSVLSLEKKSKGFEDIEKRYKKEKIKMTLKKMGTTIAAGAGTGLLTGLAEHAVMGAGGVTKEAMESRDGKASTIQESRLPRKGFEPNPVKASIPEQAPEPTVPKVATPEVTVLEAEKLFEDPNILKHEVVVGDSTWKILKGTLENNEQFKGMTEAQKTYVLSNLTNKVLQNPENYGLNKAGSLNIGDKTDFTKLFENTKEVNGVFAKAKETIMGGSAQEKSILLNNEKIAAWVEAHPNESLGEDRVTEILNSKPEIKVAPVPEIPTAETSVSEPELVPQVEPEPKLQANNAEILAGGAILAGAGLAAGLSDRAQFERGLEEDRKRLQVLEGGRDNNKPESVTRNPNLERSLANDLNRAKNGSELDLAVKAAKEETINHFFTEGLILKKEGIKSKKWRFIKDLSFKKLEKYYTGDSNMSGLNLETTNELNKSNNYKDFFEHVSWLKDQTDGAVILAEGEDPSIESVLEERGRYLLKNPQLAKLKKAA